ACRRCEDTVLLHVASLQAAPGAAQAADLQQMQDARDPFAAAAAAELGRQLLAVDEAAQAQQQQRIEELEDKIARGDAAVKLGEEHAGRRQQLAGLMQEETRTAEVLRLAEARQQELEQRSEGIRQTIAEAEAGREALGRTDTEQVRLEHQIEQAQSLAASCTALL